MTFAYLLKYKENEDSQWLLHYSSVMHFFFYFYIFFSFFFCFFFLNGESHHPGMRTGSSMKFQGQQVPEDGAKASQLAQQQAKHQEPELRGLCPAHFRLSASEPHSCNLFLLLSSRPGRPERKAVCFSEWTFTFLLSAISLWSLSCGKSTAHVGFFHRENA